MSGPEAPLRRGLLLIFPDGCGLGSLSGTLPLLPAVLMAATPQIVHLMAH